MDTINEIKQKLNIVDIIGAYVPLKKAGKSYKGLCPFHKEKSGSFIVSEDIQHYRCFGCGKSGDMFTFLMEYEGLEFKEALNILAEKAGVEVQANSGDFSKSQKEDTDRLLKINEIAADLYSNLLTKHPLGKNPLIYLKKRGIDPEIIKEFRLGYAPNSWDSLSKELVKQKFSAEELDKSGLARFRKDNKNTYDLFRARLMIPLIDHLGRIVGFVGRALLKDQAPKYVNSPETLLYHKEKFLFGLNFAKKHITSKSGVIIVEGQFDMISLYQHGYKNVVASSGTALTPAQVNLLKRYTSNLYFLFDADEAGVKASLRGAEVAEPLGVNISVIILGNDVKDPDELMQKDPKRFKECFEKALPLWDFYFYYVSKNYNFDNVFERKAASEFLLTIINKINDKVIQSKYIKKFSEVFEVKEDVVVSQLSTVPNEVKFVSKPTYEERQIAQNNTPKPVKIASKASKLELYLIYLLLNADVKTAKIMDSLVKEEHFDSEEPKKLLDFYREVFNETTAKNIDIKAFYARILAYDKNLADMFEETYLADNSASFVTNDALLKEFKATLNRIKMSFHRKHIKELTLKLKKYEASNEIDKQRECQLEINKHTEEIRLLESSV